MELKTQSQNYKDTAPKMEYKDYFQFAKIKDNQKLHISKCISIYPTKSYKTLPFIRYEAF